MTNKHKSKRDCSSGLKALAPPVPELTKKTEPETELDRSAGQLLSFHLAVKCKKCKTTFGLGVIVVEPNELDSRKADFEHQGSECPICHTVATYDFGEIEAKELKA
jgi:hypothetical protein